MTNKTRLFALLEETDAHPSPNPPDPGAEASVSSSTDDTQKPSPAAQPREEFAAELRRKERNAMAPPVRITPDPSAETLAERLARQRDLANHHAGDTFGQGGWDNNTHPADPAPPVVWLTLLPFLVLLIVAAAVTVALLMVGVH